MRVELEEVTYELTFRWNVRDEHWYMDLATGGVTQFHGVKIVHSEDLLATVDYRSVPPGRLIVSDVTGAQRDPDVETFGNEVRLLYEEAA